MKTDSQVSRARWRLVTAVLAALMICGCGKDAPPREGENAPVASASAGKVSGIAAGQNRPAAAKVITAPKAQPKTATAYAESVLTWMRRSRQQQARLEDHLRKQMELMVGKHRRFQKISLRAYGERDYARYLSDGDQLTEDGREVIKLISDVESHGLDASPYPVKALKEALARYESGLTTLDAIRTSAADGSAALSKLVRTISRVEHKKDEPYADAKMRLETALLGRGLDDSMPMAEHLAELTAWSVRLQKTRRTVREALADVDVLGLRGFFQYALDFKHMVVAQPFKAMAPAEKVRAPDRYAKSLAADLKAAGPELGRAMKGLWPAHPYYNKTRAALKQYRGYAAAGVPGWKIRTTLKRGRKGKKVLALKERLHAEGYFKGDVVNPEFGKELEAAVKTYQRAHQLKPDGIVRNTYGLAGLTRRSLNVPMSSRVRQLELSLQRWRESPSRNEPFYFRVNVPQFEVEVWEKDKLLRTHKIIVGNNRFEIDSDHGRKGHLNRTALISDFIEVVVINPIWNVPERIRISEILVEAEKDPDYLRKHGYKIRNLGNGRQQVYQAAGPGNALGRVKLLFPNKHSIYMHDTPKRKLFRRTIRTFSHGCMRLHRPVEMATFLLEHQGLMDGAEVQKVLATKKERGVRLKQKVPIHIEYNTIAFADGSEDPLFLNDVYKYDKEYYAGALPLKAEQRIPIVKSTAPPIVLDEDGRVVRPDLDEEDAENVEDPEGDGEEDGEKPVVPTAEPVAPEKPGAPEKPAVQPEKPVEPEKPVLNEPGDGV